MRTVQIRCRKAQLGTRLEATARTAKKFSTGTYCVYRAAKSRIMSQSMGGRKNLGPGCREALRCGRSGWAKADIQQGGVWCKGDTSPKDN